MNPKISVIIAARNEEKVIGECINRIKEWKYKNVEIIVVNDASTDKTKDIASSLGAIVFTSNTPRGGGDSWKFGATQARGELIILLGAESYIDDPTPYIPQFSDNNLVQIVPYQKLEGECLLARLQLIYQRVNLYLHDLLFRTSHTKEAQNVQNLNSVKGVILKPWSHALMRKSFFLEVDPPTGKGTGEEARFETIASRLITNKNYKIIYEPSFVYHVPMYPTLSRRFEQQRYYGRSRVFYIKGIRGIIKLHPLLVPIGLLLIPFNLVLGLIVLSPHFVRFVIGLRVLKKNEIHLYPLYILLTFFDYCVDSFGFIENIIHRVIKGKYMNYK